MNPKLKDKWESEIQSSSSIKPRDICNLKPQHMSMKSRWANGKRQRRKGKGQTEVATELSMGNNPVGPAGVQKESGNRCTGKPLEDVCYQDETVHTNRRKIWDPRNLGSNTEDMQIKILGWQPRDTSGCWQLGGLKSNLLSPDWRRRSGGMEEGMPSGGKKELTYYLSGLIIKL